MFQLISGLFENITWTFCTLYKLTYLIGCILITLFKHTFTALMGIFRIIAEFATIFYEDLTIFVVDLYAIFQTISVATQAAVSNVVDFLICLMYFIKDGATTSQTVLSGAPLTLATSFAAAVGAIKQLIILLGDSTWLLLTALPNVAWALLKCAWCLASNLVTILWAATGNILNALVHGCQSSIELIVDIPATALIGFIALCTAVRFRRLCMHGIRLVMASVHQRALVPAQLAAARVYQRHYEAAQHKLGRIFKYRLRSSTAEAAAKMVKATSIIASPPKRQDLNKLLDEALCVVCQDRNKCVVLFPCRHLCVCEPCAIELQRCGQSCCPLCRNMIASQVAVFT